MQLVKQFLKIGLKFSSSMFVRKIEEIESLTHQELKADSPGQNAKEMIQLMFMLK